MTRNQRASMDADNALRGAYGSLLLLAGWMREGQVGGSRAAAVRAYAEEALRAERRELLRAGLDEDVVADAQLMVIALLDESANGSPARDFAELWQRETLQYAHYSHNNLGRDFFDRLELRRSRPETPLSLLEHAARCLAFGFEGRYREENRLGDLRVLRDALHHDLQRRLGAPPPLSSPLDELAKLPPPPLVVSAPWVLGIGTALILVCGLVLSMLLYWQADEAAHTLRAGTGGEKVQGPAAANR